MFRKFIRLRGKNNGEAGTEAADEPNSPRGTASVPGTPLQGESFESSLTQSQPESAKSVPNSPRSGGNPSPHASSVQLSTTDSRADLELENERPVQVTRPEQSRQTSSAASASSGSGSNMQQRSSGPAPLEIYDEDEHTEIISAPVSPRTITFTENGRKRSAVIIPVFSAPAFFNGNVSRDLFMSQMAALPSSSLMDGLSKTYDLTQQLSKVLSMINKLSAETDLGSAVSSIIEIAYSLIQTEKIKVYIVDYTTGEIVNPIPTPGEVSKAALGTGLVGHSAMWGEIINISDAYQDHRFYPKIDEGKGMSAKSVLCIPVRDHLGRTVAVIQAVNKIVDAFTSTTGSFTRDDQSTMELIATCTGNAIGKIQLVSKMHLFMEMLKTLAAEIEPDSVIQRIISSTYELLRCERVTLFLVDHEQQMLTMAVSKDAEGFSLPMSKGIVGHVSRTGEIVNIPNAYDDERFDPATDKATGFRTRSILCVPVRAPNGQILAVIQTLNKQFGIFHREDETFLQSMAAHAGLALWKSKLYNDNLVARRRSEALLGMVRSVYESEDIKKLFKNILACIEDILQPERASLVLVDAVTGEMWLAVSEDAEGAKIPQGKGIIHHVIKEKQSVRVADAYKDERFNSAVDKATGLRTKSILCCPVIDGKSNRAIAAIQAINKGVKGGKDPQSFTEEDQELLEVLCLEVATALKRKSLEMAYTNAISQHTRGRSTSQSRAVTSFLLYAGSSETTSFISSVSMKGTQTSKMMKWPSSGQLVDTADFKNWDFDPWSVEEPKLLIIIEKIFDELGCLSELKVEQPVFQKFLIQVREKYRPNPFHNFTHAFSVLHQVYMGISSSQTLQSMDRVYLASLLIAALGHDLDHPGHTNQFEINSRSKLTLRYNDISVLENHHASVLVKLIESPDIKLLGNLPTETMLKVRKIIVESIMHTDMSKHFDLVTKLKSMCASSTPIEVNTPAQCQFVVNMILHCGDLSGQTLTRDLALKWGDRVIQEFANQAAMEREQGIPVMPFMEKLTEEKDKASMQMNFVDYVLKPMWESVGELFPGLKIKYQNLMDIRQYYADILNPPTTDSN